MNDTDRAEQITRDLLDERAPRADDLPDLAEWASHYHGGQASALYSFASTHKLVCNRRMDQADYLSEVEKDLRNLNQFDNPEESRAVLGALKTFFEVACCNWEQAQDNEHDHILNPVDYTL